MTFRATNITPSDAYRTVKRAATALKVNIADYNATMLAGAIDYQYLGVVYAHLKNANAQFNELKVIPGIVAAAKEQEDDPLYDVSAEFTTMQAAITNALAWMDANVPTNVTAKTPANWVQGGTQISNTFTTAQTAGLRTELAAVAATIS